uniref:HSF-type DNA-binding domain-containing protein n=1 Tax=Stegastes partitus TaxID=144197 RepID=A0A3B5AQE4_9TELE
MDACDYSLPLSINPNNFTAKLWRLVNNPANDSICWDGAGEVVVIHQQLFEQQILRPGSLSPSSPDAFKTTNFSSFVRQLNLYGFKKVDPDVSQPKPVNSTHPSCTHCPPSLRFPSCSLSLFSIHGAGAHHLYFLFFAEW